jgi:hypothetical protein
MDELTIHQKYRGDTNMGKWVFRVMRGRVTIGSIIIEAGCPTLVQVKGKVFRTRKTNKDEIAALMAKKFDTL